MAKVAVTIAYGNPKIAAMVQALAGAVGGPSTKCEVGAHHERVVVGRAPHQDAAEALTDLETAHEVLSRVVEWAQESGCEIRSLSLLSHASAGRFELGNEWISKSSIKGIAADLAIRQDRERRRAYVFDGVRVGRHGNRRREATIV